MLGRVSRMLRPIGALALYVGLGACTPAAAPESATALSSTAPAETTTTSGRSASSWHYELTVNEDLSRFDLRLCVDGPAPSRLRLSAGSIADIGPLETESGELLSPTGEAFELPDLGPNPCFEYSVDPAQHSSIGRWPAEAKPSAGEFVGDPRSWLLRPPVRDEAITVDLRLTPLPEGLHFSSPWRAPPAKLEGGSDPPTGHRDFGLDITTYRWRGVVAFTRERPLILEAAGARFEVAVLSGHRAASDEGIREWLTVSADTVAQLYGRYPRDRMHVVVMPIPAPMTTPVIFGMVWRGGAPSVVLRLNAHARDSDLVGEWMAVHELLHPGLPPMQSGDAWLFEGFVTYYTTILRSRAGLHREPDGAFAEGDRQQVLALTDLRAGFERGQGSAREPTLAEVSETMRRTHSYQRVYWGGAAVALDLDMTLRRTSAGARSLDDLMRGLHELCATDPYQWRAEDLLAEADDIVSGWSSVPNVVSVTEIAGSHLGRSELPGPQFDFDGLAVDLDEHGIRVRGLPSGEAELRRAIFAARGLNSRELH